ncbi:TolC family protein [Shewanella psychropiezotolerans]|uniref:TolC family protein n=1 Tax=Shewanella psychropiezotolerans TaxID=2593655 RepID=UPI00163D9B38|nr:TolC family protein [Shewanella psychropiezotolerans]
MTLPFLEYRKAHQSASRANLAYQQAETAFTERLYKALLEVDDAISNLRFNRDQESVQKQQLVLARQAAAIARSRYLAGATGIGRWIEEQNLLRQVEMSWLTQRQAVLKGYS